MIARYRKRPVVIEAALLSPETLVDVANWCHARSTSENGLTIATLEGRMFASLGDYVIKGVQGEFYPCRADIFNETYEQVS